MLTHNLVMGKLTDSPRLNKLLFQMDIHNEYDVIFHLPRRYDDLNYTQERELKDKQRVVILGKLVSLPRVVKARNISIVTFDFITKNRNYFKIVAFNRPYLSKTVNLTDEFTIIGSFSKKENEINLVNIRKGEVPLSERIKAIYTLPNDYQQYLFSNLVKKSLEGLKGHIFSNVPYAFQNKYRLIDKETAVKLAHCPENPEQIRQSLRHLKYEEALLFSLENQLIREDNKSLAKIKKEPIDLSSCKPFIDSLPYSLTEDQKIACEEIINDMNQSSVMYRLLQGD